MKGSMSAAGSNPTNIGRYRFAFTLLLIPFCVFPVFAAAAEDEVRLDTYSCSEFLRDIAEPLDGSKLLRSMMMIAWSAGYAAAHQQGAPKADVEAVRLAASALGKACRERSDEQAASAIARAVKDVLGQPRTPRPPALAKPVSGFDTYPNYDVFGGDLRRAASRTLKDCADSCESDRACQGFSFDRWNRACFLKARIAGISVDPSSTAGIRSAMTKPDVSGAAIRMTRRTGKNSEGALLKKTTSIRVEDCERACIEDGACVGFTFRKARNSCETYSSIDRLQAEPRAISGTKNQQAP